MFLYAALKVTAIKTKNTVDDGFVETIEEFLKLLETYK